MKIAIMQPYLFPYIGYFQLIAKVDKFVFYDDVNYIKNGWIDRNKIYVNDKELLFKVPISQASSFKKINETLINSQLYTIWVRKFLKTIAQDYKKAPCFSLVYPLIQEIVEVPCETIAQLAKRSIKLILNYLEINTELVDSSQKYNNNLLSRTDRLIDICIKENADEYFNPIGGVQLYNPVDFEKANINLHFVSPKLVPYKQFSIDFIPSLSIIDVLMFNDKIEINNNLLNKHE